MNNMNNLDLTDGTTIDALFLSANLRDDGVTKWYNLHLGDAGNLIRVSAPSHTDAIIKVRENYDDYLARLQRSNQEYGFLRDHHTRNE
jgi:hypothetical protein